VIKNSVDIGCLASSKVVGNIIVYRNNFVPFSIIANYMYLWKVATFSNATCIWCPG